MSYRVIFSEAWALTGHQLQYYVRTTCTVSWYLIGHAMPHRLFFPAQAAHNRPSFLPYLAMRASHRFVYPSYPGPKKNNIPARES